MRRDFLRCSLTLVAFLSLGMFAFAQRGRPAGAGPGMAGGGGMGGPGMGGPGMAGQGIGGPGMGSGNYGRPSNPGSQGMGRNGSGMSQMGSQAPGAVLSNQHLNTALTNALGKSGVSIPGGNLQQACQGFKSLGECVAALHVSNNLGLNFSQLRGMMTGPNAESLGKAVQGMGGPNLTSKKQLRSALKKANKQTKQDLHAAASASVKS